MNADVDKTDSATTPSPSQSLIVTTNPLTNLVLVPLVQLYPAAQLPRPALDTSGLARSPGFGHFTSLQLMARQAGL